MTMAFCDIITDDFSCKRNLPKLTSGSGGVDHSVIYPILPLITIEKIRKHTRLFFKFDVHVSSITEEE